ncbi:MAG: hypothetical protein EBX52_03590 [Proteobacteria bacterium]|nr:hypothetical protein [Pseudomonadota bacterium]
MDRIERLQADHLADSVLALQCREDFPVFAREAGSCMQEGTEPAPGLFGLEETPTKAQSEERSPHQTKNEQVLAHHLTLPVHGT